jgi:four helix bundle protein
MSSYQDLRVRTKQFALAIIRLCRELPRTTAGLVIGKQLIRSGTSVAANYRATQRARSKAEFISKIGIVVEEADETQFWLELLEEAQTVPSGKLAALRRESSELVAIFSASQKTAKQ